MACIEVSRDRFFKELGIAAEGANVKTGQLLMEATQNRIVLTGGDPLGNQLHGYVTGVNGDANWAVLIYYRPLLKYLRRYVPKGSILRMQLDGDHLKMWTITEGDDWVNVLQEDPQASWKVVVNASQNQQTTP